MTAYTANVVPGVGVDLSGLLVTPSATTGNTAPTGSGRFLFVKNASGAAITVTVLCPILVDGRLTTSSSTTPNIVATNGLGCIPLLDIYKDPATGLATVNFSAITSVSAAVVAVP